MIRNHSKAAVPGLTVSDVNFNVLSFAHNNGFCFSASLASYCFSIIGTPCPVKFWSPGHFILKVAMPHDFLKYFQQLNSLHFLIELFRLSTNQFEFLKSVQCFKRYTRFCAYKLGPKLEKCLTETKKEMWQIRWHHKDTEKGCFLVLI